MAIEWIWERGKSTRVVSMISEDSRLGTRDVSVG